MTADTPHGLTEAERAEASTRALADELCAGSTHARDEDAGEFHCQECYDIANTVHDSTWLTRLAAGAATHDTALRTAIEALDAAGDAVFQEAGVQWGREDYRYWLHRRAANLSAAALDADPAPTEFLYHGPHHERCENTGPDGLGCNCGAYARAIAAPAPTVETQEPVAAKSSGEVVDLLAALQRSVDAARAARATRLTAPAPTDEDGHR